MTREEKAISIIKNELACVKNVDCERTECRNCSLVMPEHDVIEALDIAIKALEQKPCDVSDTDVGKIDAVSRQAAIVALDDRMSNLENVDMQIAMGFAKGIIYDLPSINPKPKTGHWNCGDDMFEYAICSSCKHETGEAWEYAKRNFKYCPNCGLKMQKVEDGNK